MCRLLFSNKQDISKEQFLVGLSEMVHGGPDVPCCYFEYENFKFGHNRLSIIDLNKRSNQPFFNREKTHILIYNGEVYNYRELAQKYNLLLETNSDTELIIELSLKIGYEQALREFNGIFAYIIFDIKQRTFFVARDRLGVKPLYVYNLNDNYIFSSEINAIVTLLNNNVTIDPIGLRQYKKLRTFFNGCTIYENIKMFPAGSYMKDDKIQQYWNLPMGEQEPPSDEELRDLIMSSISYRKVADVSLGSYLSGGLDSTIVAALTQELHTWTVGFAENNEFEWGRLAAQKIKSEHHEILVTNQMFLNDATFMIKRRKEPLSVPNEVLLYQMTREVKKRNTVVLCGEGADELFFGYDRIFRWANSIKNFDIVEFSKLYSYGSINDIEIVESVIQPFYSYGRPIDIVAAFFQIAHLHGLLRRLDNSTMLCGVEAREPFVDYRLIERMAGVSFDYRMKNGIVKAPLKRIFRDIIPEEILTRKKVGFPVKLSDIFQVASDKAFDTWFDFNMNNLYKEVLC